MTDGTPRVRLRQAVLVAAEGLEPVAEALREALGLGEPFRDPGVGLFGLENAVFALGDCFLEIVSPTQPGTAAGRYLERQGGDGGYMVMFDLEDLPAARARAAESGVRTVLGDRPTGHLRHASAPGGYRRRDRLDRRLEAVRGAGGGVGLPGSGRQALARLDVDTELLLRWPTGSHGRALVACARGVTRPPSYGGRRRCIGARRRGVAFQPVSDRGADGLIEILVADAPSLPDNGRGGVGGVRLKVAERRPA